MIKKVWSIELNNSSSFCTFDTTGVILDTMNTVYARISYKNQPIDVYTNTNPLEYRMTILRGCVWGPGTLSQMSDMRLRFEMK